MYTKYLSLLLFVVVSASKIWGQNVPQLNQTFPQGSVTTIQVPPAPITTLGVNYIKSSTPMVPISDASAINSIGSQNLKQSYTYVDGFNRTIQSVQSNVSLENSTYKHLVQIADTRFQNDQYSFLPYASEYFGLQPNSFEAQKSYYNGVYPDEGYTSYSKSTTISDASGTRNINYGAGKSQVGQNRGSVTTGISNVAGEVRMWDIDASGNPVSTGTYAAGELFGQIISAPNANAVNSFGALSTKAFKDKDGRIVLKMVADSSYAIGGGVPQNITTYLSTYYVYDELGQLRYTLPPRAVQLIQQNGWVVSATVLNNLCFQHQYDNTGRLKAVQFPGESGFTHYVYDNKDRIVMLQTPKDKQANQYQLTYYDKLDRVIATAQYSNIDLPYDWQATFDYPPGTSFSNSDIRHYMGFDKEGVIPGDNAIAGHQLVSYHFYDNYEDTDPNNTNYTTYNNQLQFTELENTPAAEIPVRSLRTQGLLTGSKSKIFRSPGAVQISTGDWTWNHNYYDDKGRLIRSLKVDWSDQAGLVHYLFSGTQYDFLNRPLISKSIFQNLFASYSVYKEFTKNEYQVGTGALLQTSHKINDNPWSVSVKYLYDALGRVKRKTLGSYGEVQDLSYNIRGQLTGINAVYAETGYKGFESRTFGESIKYDCGFTQPQYNGKISGTIWRGSGNSHAYGYDYDMAGRLKNAEYRTNGTTGWNKTDLDYTVSNIHYDKNGNLLSMDQRGVSPTAGVQTIDNLRYSYEENELSNRLTKVVDSATDYQLGDFVNTNGAAKDYEYDLNGNLTKDANKGITSVVYTHFDKPQVISFANGKSIEYSYDVSGKKVQELVLEPGKPNKQIDYVGSYIYENNVLQYILNANGRTVRDVATDAFKEEYFVKDHLGNVRSTIDITQKPLLQYLATYELASANLEGLLFEQLNEIRDDKPASTDPGDLKAGRLNGEDQRIGTSLLMHVMAGDQVEMNVNSFYDSYDQEDDNPVVSDQMLVSIVGTLTGGVGGFEGSEGHNPDMVPQLFTPENYLDQYDNIINSATDPTRPKAYLNYVLFDENMQIDRSFSNAFQVNSNGSWEQIGTNSALTIPANGYLAVYLSNQSRGINCYECANVNFDQLVIKLQKGRQLEEMHYYPFGLPMAGLSSAADNNTKRQRHKYQSNEYIKDIGLNWMDFHARQYDPQIGRFLGVDPFGSMGGQDLYSPYAAMGNAPESMVDPNGEMFNPSLASFAYAGQSIENSADLYSSASGPSNFKKHGDYFSVGASKGSGSSISSDGASGETEGLTSQQMVDIAAEQAGKTAYFVDRLFLGWGLLLPEIEVVDHKPNFWKWGEDVYSSLGSKSPLGNGYYDFAYNKAMDNAHFRAGELGYLPPMGTVHDALETGGMLPVIGEGFDIVNGLYYSIEGDGKNAAWAFASAIPIAGNYVTGAKWAKRAYKVYEGVDAVGVIKYVGITNRNPVLRWAEHVSKGGGKELLTWRVVDGAENLTRNQARVIEQTVINQQGLGNLYNKINSISPSRWELFGVKP
ncbi:RHS repeat-associated core domain-containing protein [Pedobacter borealis]|uniref:RHS repeat-associated core domain-containing protein n=1 Tax=Pedobacter borealis TaxID=475254 RepID=UPI0004932133|nr:RHS repeat-associated core domain-containing protein [Pedobacter borealis]